MTGMHIASFSYGGQRHILTSSTGKNFPVSTYHQLYNEQRLVDSLHVQFMLPVVKYDHKYSKCQLRRIKIHSSRRRCQLIALPYILVHGQLSAEF